MQAFSNVMLALPFIIIALNPEPSMSIIEYIGAGLWCLSIIGEGLSDWQLKYFKSKPENNNDFLYPPARDNIKFSIKTN